MSAAKVTRVVLVGSREISQAIVESETSDLATTDVSHSALHGSVLFQSHVSAYREVSSFNEAEALLAGIDIGLAMAESLAKVRFEFLQTEAVKTVDATGAVLEEYAQ